ncbi:MAG: hypothetical protein C0511_06300 [Hyphomicrobium sp.]|nr:hypothetical protein [Hyphomicrobium sp.]
MLFAIFNRTEAPDHLIKQSVNATLDTAFHVAKRLLLAHFVVVTLATLQVDVRRRSAVRSRPRSRPRKKAS